MEKLKLENIFFQKDFNNFLRCKKCFFFSLNTDTDKTTETGNHHDIYKDLDYSNREVHKLAYSLFPDAVYLDQSQSPEVKVRATQELLKKRQAIIGGWFSFNKLYAYIDILDFKDDWKAYSVQKNHLRNTFQIEDLALHYLLAQKNGLDLKDYNLIYINKKYVRKDNLETNKLLNIKSVVDQIHENLPDLEKHLSDFDTPMDQSFINEIDIGDYCFKPVPCDYQNTCWSRIPPHSVFEIAGLARDTKFQLYYSGTIEQEDIKDFQDFTEAQKMQISSFKKDRVIIDKENLRHFLSGVTYPVYYMDFESFMPVIPLFKNTRPFQHIPAQYSLIKKEAIDSNEIFYDFLAEPPEYPLKSFIQSLLKDLGDTGSIFVYDRRLETRQLREISHVFPEFTDEVESIIERIIDLIIPFQKRFYYTPAMKGLASLKNTLPAIYPDFSYQDLVIQNGFMAITALESLYYETDKMKNETTRKNLKAYCQLDTLALVKIHEFFDKLLRE